MNYIYTIILAVFLMGMALDPEAGCDDNTSETIVSDTGVQRVEADVRPGADGLTVEQKNISNRLAMDNKPGSIKHLYILSAYSGQVLIYSTVQGKVTSSGKRLTPLTVSDAWPEATSVRWEGMPVNLFGRDRITTEVMQDDGTFGSSVEYLYWWDSKGTYHQ